MTRAPRAGELLAFQGLYEEIPTDWNFWGGYDVDYLDRDHFLQEFVGGTFKGDRTCAEAETI